MEAADPQSSKIPEQMKIHKFIKGLKSPHIQEKLYEEDFVTLKEYYDMASRLEDCIPNANLPGTKRKVEGMTGHPFSRPGEKRFKPDSRKVPKRCFICNQVGHRQKDCQQNRARLNALERKKCFLCDQEGCFKRNCPNQGIRKSPFLRKVKFKNLNRQSNMNMLRFNYSNENEQMGKVQQLAYVYAKVHGRI